MRKNELFIRFLAEAARTLGGSGRPEAVDMADRLRRHAAAASYTVGDAHARPPVLAHLGAALALADRHPLVDLLAPVVHGLDWTEGDLPVPASFRGRYAFVTLVGEGTPIPDDSCYFGLYLQAPATHYPSHWHAAEELYMVLSGTALWQLGTAPFAARPPGSQVLHRSYDPHAMDTQAEPLLAMWSWTGDLRAETYEIEA
jgi:dimethylpropiothetin dethiomethylase